MNWLLFAQLIAQVGLPLAEKIFQKFNQGGDVTQADIDALKAMSQKTFRGLLEAAFVQAGLPLTDPRAVALLALVPPTP